MPASKLLAEAYEGLRRDPGLPGDAEIRLKLEARTIEELVAFTEKLKRMKQTPQTFAVKYHLVRVLLERRLDEALGKEPKS